MLDLLRLYVANILGPMLEEPSKTTIGGGDQDQDELLSDSGGDYDDDVDDDDHDGDYDGDTSRRSRGLNGGHGEVEMRRQKMRRARHRRAKRGLKDTGLLDADGPKLIHGERAWLLMYQVVGQVNLLGKPLLLSIIYKLFVLTLACYVGWRDFIKPIIESKIIVGNYKNPIFIFIAFLAILVTLIHALIILYSNLFNLCPFFKVLTTPKLCFIKTEIQHIVGTKTLSVMTVFYIYTGILLKLISYNNFNEFFTNFSLWTFLLDSFCATCLGYLLVGVYQLDFYIRACFGFWIIAMKTNLEYRFAYLQRHKRLVRQLRLRDQMHSRKTNNNNNNNILSSIELDESLGDADADDDDDDDQQSRRPTGAASGQSFEQRTLDSFKDKYKIDTLNEIQKNLNTMDDHLEVCRSIQNTSLVLITLNAFLSNGAMLLLAYNLLANRGNYYHGILVILIFMNNTIFVFLCYIGDSWISYALSSFVQTVEDEYFLQGGDDAATLNQQQQLTRAQKTQGGDDDNDDEVAGVRPINDAISETVSATSEHESICRQHQSLFLIKKQDVLFCREFLHQFENHLATPWSKLTVKIHINMLGTFVTLVAAQIIFDREH